jgi:cobalt transporter subunit CbtA
VLSRVLAVGLVAGLVAGLAVAALQHVTTTPLILAAEVYETAQHAHVATSGEAAAPAEHGATPADGVERTAATSIATIAVSIGYALILLAGMLACGDKIEPRRAALWGACAFAATGLATSLGLAPQLPGAAETDLFARQLWWAATASLTGAGLFALLRLDALVAKLFGLALIAAPPLTVQALSWIFAGVLVGVLWRLFAERDGAAMDAGS